MTWARALLPGGWCCQEALPGGSVPTLPSGGGCCVLVGPRWVPSWPPCPSELPATRTLISWGWSGAHTQSLNKETGPFASRSFVHKARQSLAGWLVQGGAEAGTRRMLHLVESVFIFKSLSLF